MSCGPHHAAEFAEDLLFGVSVDAGQGVVEDEDAGIAEDGAGDGRALLLPPGESDAALAHRGLQAVREFFELAADVCGFGGRKNLASSVRPGAPKAMFPRMVWLNKNVS